MNEEQLPSFSSSEEYRAQFPADNDQRRSLGPQEVLAPLGFSKVSFASLPDDLVELGADQHFGRIDESALLLQSADGKTVYCFGAEYQHTYSCARYVQGETTWQVEPLNHDLSIDELISTAGDREIVATRSQTGNAAREIANNNGS